MENKSLEKSKPAALVPGRAEEGAWHINGTGENLRRERVKRS